MPNPNQPPVLYVDDEENDGLLMELAFRQAGVRHPLRLMTDGPAALGYLLGTPPFDDRALHPLPALVLLDFKLPRMTGLQVLERARREPALARVPFVLFSSSEQEVDQQRARAAGADEYLVKPPGMDGFVAIARMLDERWLAK